MSTSKSVAEGEIIRKKEAMDSLVHEVSRGEDESLPASLRSSLERGWGVEFIETIHAAKSKREKEIDKICSRHYGDFLTSVQELLEMRDPAATLSMSIQQVNKSFEESFQDLSDVIKSLETLQLEREHSRIALKEILRCRDLTHIIVQAKQFLADSDYYRALSSIEQLREELKHVSLHPFKNTLLKWLPGLVNQLLGAAKEDLNQWFIQIKKHTQLIGTTLMRRHAKNFMHAVTLSGGGTGSMPCVDYVTTMSLESIYRLSTVYSWGFLNFEDELEVTIPEDFFELPTDKGEELLGELLESLGPLHKALHMHGRMDLLPELHKIYCEARELVITNNFIDMNLHSLAAKDGLTVALPVVLSSLCGFFAMENIIRTSTSVAGRDGGVFTWSQLQELWASACDQVMTFCETHVDKLKTPNDVLMLKEQLLLASETLADDAFGFKDDLLMGTSNGLWTVFVNLQVESVKQVCEEALAMSGSQPIYITTFEMFETKVKGFLLDRLTFSSEQATGSSSNDLDAMEEEQMDLIRGLTDRGGVSDKDKDEAEHFVARTLPFSELVPILMRHMNIMLIRYLQFTVYNDGLVAAGHSLCNSIVMSFLSVTRVLAREMNKDGMETPLSKACQIYIDTSALSYCCIAFRDVVANVLIQAKWFETIDSDLDEIMLQCRKELDRLAIEAQHFIFELLTAKIVDLLTSLQFINWVPSVLPSGPHDSVSEIVDYLRATFMWITYLPQTIREAAHFTCCSKINQGLLEFILSPKVQKINMLSVRALQLDVQLLDEFASGCGIPQLKDCFISCRELVNAMMNRELVKFADSSQRKVNHFEHIFLNLDFDNLCALMDKVVVLPMSAEVSGVIPQHDKKTLAAIAKGVKAVAKHG